MTPYEVANSDALKVQLLETGEVVVSMWDPSMPTSNGRVDQYVDAIRTMADDVGLSPEDIFMTMYSDWSIRAEAVVAATKTGRKMANKDFEALADEAERGYDVSHLTRKDQQ